MMPRRQIWAALFFACVLFTCAATFSGLIGSGA